MPESKKVDFDEREISMAMWSLTTREDPWRPMIRSEDFIGAHFVDGVGLDQLLMTDRVHHACTLCRQGIGGPRQIKHSL